MKKIKDKMLGLIVKAKELFSKGPNQKRILIACSIFAIIMLALCFRMIFLSVTPPYDFSEKNLSLFGYLYSL